jgi:hypothetical protein
MSYTYYFPEPRLDDDYDPYARYHQNDDYFIEVGEDEEEDE